jgi:transaldolase
MDAFTPVRTPRPRRPGRNEHLDRTVQSEAGAVIGSLLEEGVEKFEQAFGELLASIERSLSGPTGSTHTA